MICIYVCMGISLYLSISLSFSLSLYIYIYRDNYYMCVDRFLTTLKGPGRRKGLAPPRTASVTLFSPCQAPAPHSCAGRPLMCYCISYYVISYDIVIC